MNRAFPAALALACVCSPAMAAAPVDLQHAFTVSLFVLGLGGMTLAALVCIVRRVPVLAILVALTLVIVLISFGAYPALAEVAVTAPTTASLPWGDWILAVLPAVSNVLVPIAAAAVTAGVYKVAPWASLLLSRQRVEMMIQGGAAYGMNAVEGVVKGKTLSVPLGSAVIAEGVQHIINTSPQRAIEKAGGVPGIAGMVFRSLPLDENSSAKAVLDPALRDLAQRGLVK